MWFVLIVFFFGATIAFRNTSWGVDNCHNRASCREGPNPRSCETVCFGNGTCRLNIALILPDSSQYIINMQKVTSLGRVAKVLGTYGMPVITPGGFVFDFTKKKNDCDDEYYMLINSGPVDYRSFAEFFIKIFEKYGWQKISLMYEKLDQNDVGGLRACQLLMMSVMEVGIEIHKFLYTDGDLMLSSLSYREYLQKKIGTKYGSR
ncbi:hypothetical protein RI129_011962 [Pyrocoelia pectoralis]|uniref:Receptor ligand binding region domain-containing protein n=1 Tax=Pyrocoelia pectoralis TaxID=417401 RepID=A0AAN7Z892_9COLE